MPDVYGNLTEKEMDWWETISGGTAQEYLTPQQEFRQFRSQMPVYWQKRVPIQDVGQRLQARYALARPYMDPISSGGVEYEGGFRGPTFRDYYGGMNNPGTYYANLAQLRERATEAGKIATMTPEAFTKAYDPGDEDFGRAAWYRMQFGGEGGRQMQQDVASMLALQRETYGGGARGAYRGQMAQAIRAAMQEQYDARFARGKQEEDFLTWYLGESYRDPVVHQDVGEDPSAP